MYVFICIWQFNNWSFLKAKIKNFETVYTSSPSFLKIIKSLGGKI